MQETSRKPVPVDTVGFIKGGTGFLPATVVLMESNESNVASMLLGTVFESYVDAPMWICRRPGLVPLRSNEFLNHDHVIAMSGALNS